jgi:hypothetical protein
MSEGVMLLWFILTGLSFAFVVFDIPNTPEDPIMKWAFVILVVFTGPLGAFFYVLGCREPLKGTHEAYVAARWRQVLGSTMHCAAGDGIGIIAGAAIAAFLQVSGWADLALEYALGFGFGWAFFQAFAMRGMAGGSYLRSLKLTFLPEFLSMNLLMAGMVATGSLLMPWIEGGPDPARPGFWFVMSMALIVGFILAYPINWWLVTHGLKHGMFTVRAGKTPAHATHGAKQGSGGMDDRAASAHAAHEKTPKPTAATTAGMTALSILGLALGIAVSRSLGA